MTKFEKRFVNRRKKAENNIKKIEEALKKIKVENIKEVLEIGCGIGLVSAYLANQYNMTVYGTDFDPEEIQMAKEFCSGGPGLYFQVEDGAKLSFSDSCFDLVVSQNVFHHIPDWPKAVDEISRVLRPGGCLIWQDLVFPGWLKKLFKPVTKNYGLYTLTDVQSQFDQAGFKTVQKQTMIHGPFKHCELVLMIGC
jgi:ubiquinone/menaquinone biosynthesis C-methylase UbiE